jgi:predicted nuclease of restriction endonuclease-like RecB superfamily
MNKGPNLQQIIIALENIEKQNLSKEPQIIEWINHITDPDFDLVNSLIDLFIENKGEVETQKMILKVLR